jgi:hypothetical protein
MKNILNGFILLFSILISAGAAHAQTTSFVYQGKLQDGGAAANGTYEFQFRLYDQASGGNQISLTLSNVQATVQNGIFAVNLNFGAGAFNSQDFRFLEIAVRQSGSGQAYTILNPRQQITSTPFAIRALNAQTAETAIVANDAANLGGIAAAQYVVTTDPRMTDERSPLPGSPNYIQNSTSQQAASNFNVSGEGKAFKFTSVLVNATSEFQQGGARVLQFNAQKSGVVGLFTGTNSTGADNMFVGYEAGKENLSGSFNSFFGSQSGRANTTGLNNSFFGAYSGIQNQTGSNNAFFGANSGLTNETGGSNSFFGSNAGLMNKSGTSNSFFGNLAGQNNSSGLNNSLFGRSAGANIGIAGNNSIFGAYSGESTTSGGNAFFGAFSGQKTSTGFSNVFIGMNAGKENLAGSNNVYIGFNAGGANQSGINNVAVGSNASLANGVSNSVVVGTNALVLQSNTFFVGGTVSNSVLDTDVTVNGEFQSTGTGKFPGGLQGASLSVGGGGMTVGGNATFSGSTTFNGSLGAQTIAASGNGLFQGSLRADTLGVAQLWNGGSTPICVVDVQGYRNIANCSSSRRYKDNIEDYRGGLRVLRSLRPVTFRWKSNGQADVGFVAEEVNEIEPLLNNFNEKGEIEGVKYAQITTVLVNSVKEQQTQIEKLEDRIKRQSEQIELLKMLVCAQNPNAAVCSEKPVAETVNPEAEKENE